MNFYINKTGHGKTYNIGILKFLACKEIVNKSLVTYERNQIIADPEVWNVYTLTLLSISESWNSSCFLRFFYIHKNYLCGSLCQIILV